MAFLDNSGDIILDAVLTDLGRRRMAAGNFSITRFSLGDDEIDYSLYKLNHPSGSAYTDLEILQTPIFEAFSKSAAGINYGLTSMMPNILYMPEIVQNSVNQNNAVQVQQGVIYMAANAETATALKASAALGSTRNFLQSGQLVGSKLMFESGINSADVDATRQNSGLYLANQGMMDTNFSVEFDTDIFGGCAGTLGTSKFNNNDSTGADEVDMRIGNVQTLGASRTKRGFARSRIVGVANTVTNVPGGQARSNVSNLKGPGGTAAAMNFTMSPGMTNTKDAGTTSPTWTKKGETGKDLFGDGKTYDVITTNVEVTGEASGQKKVFTVRCVRRAT